MRLKKINLGGIHADQQKAMARLLQPGHRLRIDRDYTYEIRDVVDGLLVTRFWNRHHARWSYEVKSPYFFWIYWKDGRATKQKTRGNR